MKKPSCSRDRKERRGPSGLHQAIRTLALAILLSWMAARGHGEEPGAPAGAGLKRSALYDYEPPAPGSYALPRIKKAGDGEVLTAAGKPAELRELLNGRVTVLSFIYLRCASPTACPHATAVLNQLQEVSEGDQELRDRMQLITLSFDPEHDTPEKMAAYSSALNSDTGAPWEFLTTRSREVLEPILAAYDQTVDKRGNARDPLGPYYHPVRVYLVDAAGDIRNIYSYGLLDPRLILADVKTVLAEAARNPSTRNE